MKLVCKRLWSMARIISVLGDTIKSSEFVLPTRSEGGWASEPTGFELISLHLRACTGGAFSQAYA